MNSFAHVQGMQRLSKLVLLCLVCLPITSGCGSSKKPADQTIENDMMTIRPVEKTSRRDDVEMTRVFEVRTGMSEDQVVSLLGEPHEKQRTIIKATPLVKERDTEQWTYRGGHEDDMITLVIEEGRVTMGGSVGWDFDKGFIGTPSEKKRIIEHYQRFLKDGGKPPFDASNPPAPGGS